MILNAIIYFVLYLLVLNLRDSYKNKGDVARLIKGMRIRHFGWSLLTIPVTIIALITLAYFGPDWFQWGWFKALTGQSGTALSAGTVTQNTVPTFLIIALYVMLVLSMPFMVLGEEKTFRRGSEKRGTITNVIACILFGLTHMIIGFPIFAALALTAPALLFTWVYQRSYAKQSDPIEATLESSRAHLAHNFLAIALAVIATTVVT